METRRFAGKTAYSSDGKRVGKVISAGEERLLIEKGFFFPKDFLCRPFDVVGEDDESIVLRLTERELLATAEPVHEQSESPRGVLQVERAGAGSTTEETRIPLAVEELSAEKRVKQTGAIRVHKEIVTEHRTITVPVLKERVRIERVSVEADQRTPRGDAKLESGTITIPIYEEEVEIVKRPVIKEELRIRRDLVTEEQRAEADVRRETAHVEDRGGVARSDPDKGGGFHV